MSGIYIHIPFCKKACHYCNFHFSTSLRLRRPMIDAIKAEIILQRDYLKGQTINTVYFGGGTPSLLEVSELMEIWQSLETNFYLGQDMEITLEANPDDLNPDKLRDFKNYTPINRLSIGIQSFREADLQYMNRAHNAYEAENCIENALKFGFDQLSVDLIYGTPGMIDDAWRANLHKVFEYRVQHLSSYALTVEPKTALQQLIAKGKTSEVNEEQTARQFEILLEETSAAGYEQYEISNFCIPPHYAKHNSAYWQGAHYLGIGPSAHSFNGISRQWNIANNAKYITELEAGNIPSETEILGREEQYNEFIMTSLRTKWGAALHKIEEKWGSAQMSDFETIAAEFVDKGLMINENGVYRLSNSGKLLADSIMSDLFI
jgi:oxygen-independent coproporphyrinogen III oxidase